MDAAGYKQRYAAAVVREKNIRNAAMLELSTRICGRMVHPLTLAHWIILEGIDSPFLTRAIPIREDVVKFLWVLSPQFNRKTRSFRRWWFIRQCRHINFGDASLAILRLVEDTFQDFPAHGEKQSSVSYICSAANIINRVGGRAGDWRVVMHTPLKVTFQIIKAIDMNDGKKPFNPSDSIEGERLRELNAALKKERRHE